VNPYKVEVPRSNRGTPTNLSGLAGKTCEAAPLGPVGERDPPLTVGVSGRPDPTSLVQEDRPMKHATRTQLSGVGVQCERARARRGRVRRSGESVRIAALKKRRGRIVAAPCAHLATGKSSRQGGVY
jgi:hypothetical protein